MNRGRHGFIYPTVEVCFAYSLGVEPNAWKSYAFLWFIQISPVWENMMKKRRKGRARNETETKK